VPVIAILQTAKGSAFFSPGSGSVSATISVSAGNFVAIGILAVNGTFGTITSITDNLGNTYFRGVDDTFPIAGPVLSVWEGIITHSGTATITANGNNGGPSIYLAMVIASFSFVKGSAQVVANIGAVSNPLDCNQFDIPASNALGTHWMIGIGANSGAQTLVTNNGMIWVQQANNSGVIGICSLKAQPNQIVDPTMTIQGGGVNWQSVMLGLSPLGVVVYRGKIPHA
jgi:hypothetical protein